MLLRPDPRVVQPLQYTPPPGVVPKWDGVVMIIREDPTDLPHTPFEEPTVEVMSARSLALFGRRAIRCRMLWSQVHHYFRTQDEDHVFVRAELHGEHLQLGERCTLKEWAETSHQSPNH